MKTVKPNSEFVALSEEEILKALDSYEEQYADADGEDLVPSDPIVAEVARLISEYTARFDEYCAKNDEIPVDILDFQPETAVERVAFEIFTDAVHDALQAEDDEEE